MQKGGATHIGCTVRCIDDVVLTTLHHAKDAFLAVLPHLTTPGPVGLLPRHRAEYKMRQNSGNHQVCIDAWLQRPGRWEESWLVFGTAPLVKQSSRGQKTSSIPNLHSSSL